MRGQRSGWWESRSLVTRYTLTVLVCVLELTATTLSQTANQDNFRFTHKLYNATIPEMAPGKTYVTSGRKMGIYISDPKISVVYKIDDGDKSGIFKCEDVRVGDFVFLRVRTLSTSYGRLNRELESRYHLKIKAVGQINQGGSMTATTDLIISVLDKNDLYPLFDKDVYNTTVGEDTALFSSVLSVSASDGDAGVNSEVYYRFVQKTNAFAIHPTSGVITLTQQLDYYVRPRYDLDVVAEDRGPRSRGHNSFVNRHAKITILVSPANFFAPRVSFKTLPTLEDSGQENGHAGVVYAILTITDDDTGENGKIDSVRIIEDVSGSFKIFPTRDIEQYELVLVKKIDTSKISDNLHIAIEVTDKGDPARSSRSRIPVNVRILGEGSKLFAQESFNAAIKEDIPVGSSVTYLRASDRDIGKASGIEYKIVSGNELKWFEVSRTTGLIKTAASLDTESVKAVTLKVNAIDLVSAGKVNRDSVFVNITILDCNDNSPVFDINETNIAIDENLPEQSVVYKVKATDADDGDNGRISFSLSNIEEVPFTIDHFTGTIKLTKFLDFETMKRLYRVKVRASDWGSPFQRESEIVLNIHLGNVNDNKPIFEKIDCSGYLSHEANVGTEIVTVPAIDFDNSLLSYYIISGNDDLCFAMDTTSGTLTLNCSMLEETVEERKVTVGVRDDKFEADPVSVSLTLVNNKKNIQLSNKDANVQCHQTNASQELTNILHISRQNNKESVNTSTLRTENLEARNLHVPTFNSSMFNVNEISENVAIGTTVLTVAANDLDPGYNGLLRYSIIDGDPYDQFQVDPHTGDIVLISKLDREQIARYDLEILVSDSSPIAPRRSASAIISFNILDENDNVPEFEKDLYEAEISEGILVNATVIQVVAKDRDLGLNGRVEYAIAADTDLFAVDRKNGIVTVHKTLDREVKDVYSIPIKAYDLGAKSLSSITTVKVKLLDVNDNVPRFIPEIYEIKLREDLPLGAVVATLHAEDKDEGDNGKIKYQLLYGVEDTFEIDEVTGIVRLVKELDFESKQVYNISAHASDGGSPPLMSACFMNIEVIDVNENVEPPVFEHFYEVGLIKENYPVGSVVMVISASDPDAGADQSLHMSPVTYSIRDGTGMGYFTIDDDGTIRTNKVLDRETTDHYWLTVYATDRGIVPLHARLEIYIKVVDVNDNVPQFHRPVYYMEVEESSPAGRVVGQVQGYDKDENPTQELSYSITDSDSKGCFAINSVTGVITTTKKKLDRDNGHAQRIIEVTVSDNGKPNLSSTAKVVISLLDINDNKPAFLENLYWVRSRALGSGVKHAPLVRVTAKDKDEGANAEITYKLKGKSQKQFTIDENTGMIYADGPLLPKSYELKVRAYDKGKQRRRATARVRLEVSALPATSPTQPPRFPQTSYSLDVFENCEIGQLVDVVQAETDQGEQLWYSIVDGDDLDQFTIHPNFASILVARPLDHEVRDHYNLTISATNGAQTTTVQVNITVFDVNDNTPCFTNETYNVTVPESAAPGSNVIQVSATDRDKQGRLIYKFTSAENEISLQLFEIDSESGMVRVKEKLDREVMSVHELTVMVRDQGVQSNRNYTRVLIRVEDHNDHAPAFLSDVMDVRVFETSAVGTSVIQLTALDQDKGANAEVTYAIVSGNIDMAFSIDETLGIISVAKELDKSQKSAYKLIVMATDNGLVPLSSTATVNIVVTMSSNAPPKFFNSKYSAGIDENSAPGSHVTSVFADSQSSVTYTIVGGNENFCFAVNPNSGVIYLAKSVDFEEKSFFNLTLLASNIVGKTDSVKVEVQINDINDNEPYFLTTNYNGSVSESSPPRSLVLDLEGKPLVIKAEDKDSNQNSRLIFKIVECKEAAYFTIDQTTGAIKTKSTLDHEQYTRMEFYVQVSDQGKPQQTAAQLARVVINIEDVNDNPPVFKLPQFHARLLLPTAANVAVVKVNATDPDTGKADGLKFSLANGDHEKFHIDEESGVIYVLNETNLAPVYDLKVVASDGKFDTSVDVKISVISADMSRFSYLSKKIKLLVKENQNFSQSLTVIQVSHSLNQNLVFTLLNFQDMFSIMRTSGVLQTKGREFDREERAEYRLIILVEDLSDPSRSAHILVEVTVEDENDHAPLFVNLPYDTVVPVTVDVGTVVRQVTAIDKDARLNGEVEYSLVSGDEDYFMVESSTGKIKVQNKLSSADIDKEIQLTVQAQDKGTPSQMTTTPVSVRVISSSHPVFPTQYYTVSIREDLPTLSPFISVNATSPNGHKLIYSIASGDPYREFDVDFNLGVVQVTSSLDYESTKEYDITVRASDIKTGSYADARINIKVLDVNDQKPVFSHYKYTAVLSEAASIGNTVTIVTASDSDTGLNAMVHYDIIPDRDVEDVHAFEVDSTTGLITTKQELDHEIKKDYSFLVMATDSGLPALSSAVPVHVIVSDLNDNPPYFDQPSYNCFITDQSKSLIVTKVSASDPDFSSQGHLEYSIIDGNLGNAFLIDADSGVITLSSQDSSELYHSYLLNVSVTDGVFTSFARVSISVRNSNRRSPVFQRDTYRASIMENVGEGMLITTVTASDEDRGNYGMLTYTILSAEMRKHFTVDADTGEVYAARSFDREEQDLYSVTIAATDNGGRMGFAIINIDITDINDNIPQFSMTEYKAAVAVNASVGSKIIQVQAEDNDLGSSGRVTYEMHAGNLVDAGDLFSLDADTGFVSVKKNLSAYANEVFQFFITAQDHGKTQLKNTVPVEIYVMNADQELPLVKERNSFVIPAEEMVGTVIGTVMALSADALDYSIVPGYLPEHNSEGVFSINEAGQIRLMEKWRENKLSKYIFSVKVQSRINQRLVAYSVVEVVVSNLDVSRPEFEAAQYDVTLAENSEVRSKVVQCRILDAGSSFANVRYKFDDWTVRTYENMFSIDPYSGWVTLEMEADREKQDFYNLTVIAEAKGVTRKFLNSTLVNIQITDHNDNPPVFSQSHYIAAVNEDALTGTILMTLTTTDADVKPNTDVEYLVIEGDTVGKFRIHRSGEIYVSKHLDREAKARYELLVAATDGGMASMATVTVDILDANDNTPVCEQPNHQKVLSEDVGPNTIITQVKATDADDRMTPNAVIQYQLKGNNTLFQVNKEKGVLTNVAQLDRESKACHHLIISAVDGGGRSCDTEVYIELSDVNDNPPLFVDLPDDFSIPESAEADTLLLRINIHDPDLGINRQVKYKLKDDSEGTFSIDEESGILKLTKAIDREVKPKHQLILQAYDQGTPSLTSEAALEIIVLDENDNPPEFVRNNYKADIPEDASIGTRVVRVTATSKDIGENARMTYLITAGNNMGKFVIDQNKGDIRVANHLDREVIFEYILTVVARDNGQPPLSSSAFVTINITDVNDNKPMFSQSIYRASVLESKPVGALVTKVIASDVDSPPNAALTYSILQGNKEQYFSIDKKTGNITVNRPLDREKVPQFSLDVRVTDGLLFSDAKVVIEIRDVNDCPPRFSQDNYTAIVQEDRKIGYNIINFTATDDDLAPNGRPFTFDIIAGNEGGQFRIDNHGILSTASKFNHYIKDSYYLIVRVFDNGTPPLYSDAPVYITIVEEGLNPPVVKNLDVSIKTYRNRFPGGIIGTLEARDEDVYDELIFKVISPNRHLFDVDKREGRVIAFPDLDPGNYVINISVYDGHYVVYGAVNVEVNSVSQSMLESAVTVQLQSLTPAKFFASYARDFQRAIKRIMNVRSRDVEILNVQPSSFSLTPPERLRLKRSTDEDLDVLFAVRKSGNSFYRQRKVQRKVMNSLDILQSTLNVRVLKVMDDICPQESCNDGMCTSFVQFDDSLTPLDVAGSSYVTGRHYYVYQCTCHNGIKGDSCPEVPPIIVTCETLMCPYNKVCEVNPYSGPQCVCPEGKTGDFCEKDVPGLGRCSDFSCYKGEKPMTFAGNSYAKWTLKEEFTIERRLSLTLRIKTRRSRANLMYAKGQFDYSILEIENGMVQYKFNCGKGEGRVVIPKLIDDGEWHTIQVERDGREAEIKLDRQFTGYGMAPGIHEVLNLNSKDVYFGAEVDISFGGYHDIKRGFDGCMEDIKLFNVRLPFDGQNAVVKNPEFKEVEFHCKDTKVFDGTNICSTKPCMNGGRCETDGNQYNCICPDRFLGTRCELDTNPCADTPCRNDGTCQIIPDSQNDFRCVCKDNLKGKFCEYGRWCNSNPCHYGGTCVEGIKGYLCFCPYGFAGNNCQYRNVCESNPCKNDGRCVSRGEAYVCNCTGNYRGKHCEDEVLSPQITSNKAGITQIELYIIVGIASGLIFLAFLFVIIQCFRRHRHRRRRTRTLGVHYNDGETDVMLKGVKDSHCKVSEFDISNIPPPSPRPPPVPNRPASYTPSNHDSLNTLNNFDIVRNYGSAADELENCHNIPYTQEFLASFAPPPRSNASMPPSLPPPPPSNPASDTDSIQKPWEIEYPNMMENVQEKHHPEKFPRQKGAFCPETTSFSSLPQSESEDEPGPSSSDPARDYHWDASDWAPRPSLPNISELPMKEIPDSPSASPHSNESNTHIGYQNFQDSEMYTDPEMLESEYVGDSEFADNECDNDDQCYMSPPNYRHILGLPQTPEDEDEDSYNLPQDNLVMHPNQYLPHHSFDQSQEFSGDRDSQSQSTDWPEPPSCDENEFYTSGDNDDDIDVVTYGFPKNKMLAKGFLSDGGITDSEYNVRNSITDRMSMSMGGNASTNASVSDISGLCDIEDSEVNLSDGDSESENDENTPLNNAHQHTTV